MKWLFLLLAVANLLFWGYTKLAEPPGPVDWHAREINPDKVQWIAPDADKPAAEENTKAANSSDASPPSADLACFDWRGIGATEVDRAKQKLRSLKLEPQQFDVELPDGPTRYWVYAPPRATFADAQKKAEEYQRLGINDFFIVNDGGKWQNAIALGLYSSQEAADKRLAALQSKGVKSAQIRERSDALLTATILLNRVPVASKADLEAVAKGFRGSVLAQGKCH